MNPMSEIEAAVSTGPKARPSLMNVYELVESTLSRHGSWTTS